MKNNLIILSLLSIVGCASSLLTSKSPDPKLMSRYYKAPYEEVFTTAVDVAKSFTTFDVENFDQELGVIIISDSNIWRTYIIRIIVKKTDSDTTVVDITSSTSADLASLNKSFVRQFYGKLDAMMNKEGGVR